MIAYSRLSTGHSCLTCRLGSEADLVWFDSVQLYINCIARNASQPFIDFTLEVCRIVSAGMNIASGPVCTKTLGMKQTDFDDPWIFLIIFVSFHLFELLHVHTQRAKHSLLVGRQMIAEDQMPQICTKGTHVTYPDNGMVVRSRRVSENKY